MDERSESIVVVAGPLLLTVTGNRKARGTSALHRGDESLTIIDVRAAKPSKTSTAYGSTMSRSTRWSSRGRRSACSTSTLTSPIAWLTWPKYSGATSEGGGSHALGL